MNDTKKTAHTPGPWWVTPAQHGTVYVEARAQESRMLQEVAAIGPKEGGSEQRDADARLIAAAPELLDAAKRSAAALLSAGVESNANSDNPLESLLHMTLAAIAKATGGAA